MRRTTLGIIALVLVVVGAIAAFNGPGGSSAWGFSGVCMKSGLVLGALWLALPQIQAMAGRVPRWLLSCFVGKSAKEQKPTADNPQTTAKPRPRRRSDA